MLASLSTTRSEPRPDTAFNRLRLLALTLGSADPVELLGNVLSQTFDQLQDAGHTDNSLAPGCLPLECSFSELDRARLRMDFEPFGAGIAPTARLRLASAAASQIARCQINHESVAAFNNLASAWQAGELSSSARFGAFLGASLGVEKLEELKIYYEVDSTNHCLLPVGLTRLLELVPGALPHFFSVSLSQTGISSRLYARCRRGLHLTGLEPLMTRVGLGHRLPALISTVLRLTDMQFTMPPEAAGLGLRQGKSGFELKVELVTDIALGFMRSPIEGVRDELRQRPVAKRAFETLFAACSEFGKPAQVSVVSVTVTASREPRLNVYLRPAWGLGTPVQMLDEQGPS